MNEFVMPLRWNEDKMSNVDILHKKLQMQFMWSDYFINKGDLTMFNKCQNDITRIRVQIKRIKEKQKQQFLDKQNKKK